MRAMIQLLNITYNCIQNYLWIPVPVTQQGMQVLGTRFCMTEYENAPEVTHIADQSSHPKEMKMKWGS